MDDLQDGHQLVYGVGLGLVLGARGATDLENVARGYAVAAPDVDEHHFLRVTQVTGIAGNQHPSLDPAGDLLVGG